jgi:hypothetical protein
VAEQPQKPEAEPTPPPKQIVVRPQTGAIFGKRARCEALDPVTGKRCERFHGPDEFPVHSADGGITGWTDPIDHRKPAE